MIVLCGLALAVAPAGGRAHASVSPVAAATDGPPTVEVVDPADTPGPLDLRTVHMTQSLGDIRWAFKTGRPFRLVDMSAGSAARTACLVVAPKGRPVKQQRLCITGTSLRARALYRSPVNPGGPKGRVRAGHHHPAGQAADDRHFRGLIDRPGGTRAGRLPRRHGVARHHRLSCRCAVS